MSDDKKAFYEYHSCLMEPWDGPASMAFTDGTVIGAVLDRNGLRPCRYRVTKDGLRDHGAPRAGVLDMIPPNVEYKGRLQPGPHVPGRHGRRDASSPTRRSRKAWRLASLIARGSTSNSCSWTICPRRRSDPRHDLDDAASSLSGPSATRSRT